MLSSMKITRTNCICNISFGSFECGFFIHENWWAGAWEFPHWRKENEGSIVEAAADIVHHRRSRWVRRCVWFISRQGDCGDHIAQYTSASANTWPSVWDKMDWTTPFSHVWYMRNYSGRDSSWISIGKWSSAIPSTNCRHPSATQASPSAPPPSASISQPSTGKALICFFFYYLYTRAEKRCVL